MSTDLSQSERGFLRNLLENSLPDETAIDNFIDFIVVDELAKALKDNMTGKNREAKHNSIINIAHSRHAIGDLLLELSRKLGKNRDDIAVAGALFTEKYQKATSKSKRNCFFRVERASLEKLTSVEPFLRVKELGDFLGQAERRICKVKCLGKNRGTGFLIGEDLVLTCFHVVEDGNSGQPHSVNSIEVEFDFLDGTHPTTTYALNSKWTIPYSKYSDQDLKEPPGDAENDALDYAVLKLAKAAGRDQVNGFERGHFDIGTQKMPPMDTPILIAGHPGPVDLQPLSLSMAAPGYMGLTPNKTRMIYKASTEPGSSGSPVFDHNFNLIGLHHNRGANQATITEFFENNRGIPIKLISESYKKKMNYETRGDGRFRKVRNSTGEYAIMNGTLSPLFQRVLEYSLDQDTSHFVLNEGFFGQTRLLACIADSANMTHAMPLEDITKRAFACMYLVDCGKHPNGRRPYQELGRGRRVTMSLEPEKLKWEAAQESEKTHIFDPTDLTPFREAVITVADLESPTRVTCSSQSSKKTFCVTVKK